MTRTSCVELRASLLACVEFTVNRDLQNKDQITPLLTFSVSLVALSMTFDKLLLL